MTTTYSLSDKVAIGGQPTVEDLHELRAQGFVAVVNLRTPGESGQTLSPEAEGFAAQEVGLDYSRRAGGTRRAGSGPCAPPARRHRGGNGSGLRPLRRRSARLRP